MLGGPRDKDAAGPATVGLYVHVPFCERVCPYCDFAVVAANPLGSAVEARYVAALEAELEQRAPRWRGGELATIYFGGGTPSLVDPARLARVIDRARAALGAGASSDLEITLEVNPSTVERARLPAFRAVGIDRLSIGIQSFEDRTLKRLGRAHRADESGATIEAARAAGFENVSIDLILGAPGQSRVDYERDLARALEVAPEHLSIYELTIEEGTPFALANRRGQLDRADEDDVAAMLELTAARTRAAGLHRYEISSYAREGFESRHNRRYWTREPVLGIGMGAWSSHERVAASAAEAARRARESSRAPQRDEAEPFSIRRANPRALDRYLAWVESGASLDAASDFGGELDPITGAQARTEAIFLGLRQVTIGVEVEAFAREFGAAPRAYYAEEIERLIAEGLLVEDEPSGDLRLTERGLLLSDTVFAEFV